MAAPDKIPLLVVAGPTASGKTALAVEMAKRFGGEVVSADSMQVYQKLNIATAKPDTAEMQGVPHHLIDFLEPDAPAFSVADYAQLAHEAIKDIHSRGKLPVLAGGTGLYIKAVADNVGYGESAKSDADIRAKYRRIYEEQGAQALHDLLTACDPRLAASLHPNNAGRVIRALEVFELTGIPMSEHQRRALDTPELYKSCMLGIAYENRELLYMRINTRVDRMMAAGLLEEARQIREIYGGTAAQAIGYKELEPYFLGEASLEDCIESLKRATRRYAKRQLTWFMRDERICWLMADRMDKETFYEHAAQIVHNSGIL